MMLKASEEFDLDALLSQMEELADKHRLTCGVSCASTMRRLAGCIIKMFAKRWSGTKTAE
jgi:hypothetical protein